MKHAGQQTLEVIESMLRPLRAHPMLIEKSPGSFYIKSNAFLHFHEDPVGVFADVKADLVHFERHRVTTKAEQKKLLGLVDRCLKEVAGGNAMREPRPSSKKQRKQTSTCA
jgi:hypothetical protein